eukprot:767141-Hanusia_phi.AAC.6
MYRHYTCDRRTRIARPRPAGHPGRAADRITARNVMALNRKSAGVGTRYRRGPALSGTKTVLAGRETNLAGPTNLKSQHSDPMAQRFGLPRGTGNRSMPGFETEGP